MSESDHVPPIAVTVGILTHNSTATLAETIHSVSGCAEVLVCDGNSTDGTRELAVSLGCTLIDQAEEHTDGAGRLVNMTGVREQMVEAAAHDWVLVLDHDELATPELLAEIESITTASRRCGVYDIPRLYVLNGTVIRSAANYPSYQTRLVHRDAIEGYAGIIHDHPVLKAGELMGKLESPELVPLPLLRELWPKWLGYMRLEEVGKLDLSRSEWVDQVLKPEIRMVRWLARRIAVVRRGEPKPHLPLYVELNRIAYELGVVLYTGRRFLGIKRADQSRAWQ